MLSYILILAYYSNATTIPTGVPTLQYFAQE